MKKALAASEEEQELDTSGMNVPTTPKRKRKKKKKRGKAISCSKKGNNQNVTDSPKPTTNYCEQVENPEIPTVNAKQDEAILSLNEEDSKLSEFENTEATSSSKECENGQRKMTENTTDIPNEYEVNPHIHTIQEKKKLLILDINGVLADVVDTKPKECTECLSLRQRYVIRRPFCEEFLHFCFKKFHVAVWSSRTIGTLETVVPFIFQNLHLNLLFCWSRSECTKTGYTTVEEKSKPLVLKELRKVWEYDEDDGFDETNTLLIDDSPYKALRNPPYTAIFPYSYSCKNLQDFALGEGGEIRVYLEGIADVESVPDYVANHSFGQKPISESNASWEFYKMIIG